MCSDFVTLGNGELRICGKSVILFRLAIMVTAEHFKRKMKRRYRIYLSFVSYPTQRLTVAIALLFLEGKAEAMAVPLKRARKD